MYISSKYTLNIRFFSGLALPATIPVPTAQRLSGKRVLAVNNSDTLCSSFTANKMPAVHHKLLLEEALQDSPQVRLCELQHVSRHICHI